MKLSEELQQRGFIHQTAGDLSEIVDGAPRTIYHGIDPSADSAHAGNFVQWILLRHLAQAGHKIIFLVGGATGRIGDPKPDAERALLDESEVEQNIAAIRVQAEKCIGSTDITFVNNYDWFAEIKFIDFLRDIGKHFTVNELIKKDAIANRLASDIGLSYTEFAYPLIQGYDYLALHRMHGCEVQTGGSDQWGNIVAGVDLVRRTEGKTVYAITQPLVIDKTTGQKFGKSEGNAVWLDPAKTSPYQFYQFWLNTADENVIDFLKRFTFIDLAVIDDLEQQQQANPGARVAQRELAKHVTELVHGVASSNDIIAVSETLFGGTPIEQLSSEAVALLQEVAPNTVVASGTPLVEVLVTANLATSKREARTFIESGAVYLNDTRTEDVEMCIDRNALGQYALLRRGKKQYTVLEVH